MFHSLLLALHWVSWSVTANDDLSDATAMLQGLTRRGDNREEELFDSTVDELASLDAPLKIALIQRMTSPVGWSGLVEKFKTLPKPSKVELLQMGSTLPELKGLLSRADIALFQAAAHEQHMEQTMAEKGENKGDNENSASGKDKAASKSKPKPKPTPRPTPQPTPQPTPKPDPELVKQWSLRKADKYCWDLGTDHVSHLRNSAAVDLGRNFSLDTCKHLASTNETCGKWLVWNAGGLCACSSQCNHFGVSKFNTSIYVRGDWPLKYQYWDLTLCKEGSGRPCEKCQGDCDGDGGCQSGLKCFQRGHPEDATAKVPGCTGENGDDDYNIGFCIDPLD